MTVIDMLKGIDNMQDHVGKFRKEIENILNSEMKILEIKYSKTNGEFLLQTH